MIPSKGWLCVDIETSGDPWTGKLLCVGVADPFDPVLFAKAFAPPVPDYILNALRDPDVGIIEHTLYDARWLRLHGYEVNGPIADTRVMAWNHNENQKLSLEALALRYLGLEMDKRITPSGKRFRCDDGTIVPLDEAPEDQLHAYCEADVRATCYLFEHLKGLQPEYYWESQLPLTSVLLDMECAGLPIDEKRAEELRWAYSKTRDTLSSGLTQDLPPNFNLNSDDQVAAYIYLPEFDLPGKVHKGEEPEGFKVEKEGRVYSHGSFPVKGLGLKPRVWTDSGSRPKVDEDTLAYYQDNEWVRTYSDYQKVNKILTTYLGSFPRFTHGGRMYGTFNQAGTVTGRLSSSEPNLQNLPRRGELGSTIRELFRGNLIVADFSQLEPRLMAHWSEDPALTEVYREGLDVYRRTASGVFKVEYEGVSAKQREICKTIVLAMGYGAKSRRLARELTLAGYPTNERDASGYLTAMQDTYHRLFEWREEVIEDSKKSGFVTTLAGRTRKIGYDGEGAWKAERQAVNSVIQGSAADIVNETMLIVSKLLDIDILVQVHDELVLEYHEPPNLLAIQEAGERGHGFELRVPLVFEPKIVESWGEK